MGSRCVVYKCRAEAAGLLCWRHLHELDVEAGVRGFRRQEVGSQSGHGAFGVLDRTESGVLCHECGERFASLGRHVRRGHQLDPDEYRYTHGLDPRESLSMPRREDGVPRRRAHPCRWCGVDVTTRAKLCPGCKVQRAEALAKKGTPRRPRWRDLTAAEERALADAESQDLPRLVAALQGDRVPSAAIGRVLGRGTAWMSKHFPRPGWGDRRAAGWLSRRS